MQSRAAPLTCNPGHPEERRFLVRKTDAIRECRVGAWRELQAAQALQCVEGIRRRDMAGVRTFAAQCRLAACPLTQLADLDLIDLVRRALVRGEVAVVEKCDAIRNDRVDSAREQRRLVRDIANKARQGLSHGGRKYRLVADVDLAGMSGRDRYEVVGHDDGAGVLTALARQAASSQPDLASLLQEARGELADDWRPPFHPDGLVLLRRIVTVAAAASVVEAPITPSQLKQLIGPKDLIEIELVDSEGQPIPGETWEIVLPDGSRRTGQLDATGHALVDSIPSGVCQVAFPGLDADAWALSG